MYINILGILSGILLNFLLGMLWYSQTLFGNDWLKLVKLRNIRMNRDDILLAAAIGLVSSLAMAIFIWFSGADSFFEGVVIGCIAGVGFCLTTISSNIVWSKRPYMLILIDGFYYVLYYSLLGGILAVI